MRRVLRWAGDSTYELLVLVDPAEVHVEPLDFPRLERDAGPRVHVAHLVRDDVDDLHGEGRGPGGERVVVAEEAQVLSAGAEVILEEKLLVPAEMGMR